MVRSDIDGAGAVPIFIGTAGWGIASRYADAFPGDGTHLERYARRLNCAEINTSFYRPHSRETYERWAGSVPEDFRFSVKLPKAMSHDHRLAGCGALLEGFVAQVEGLGEKLGALLVQLPPNLDFDLSTAEAFFMALREATDVALVCEPRHAGWFSPEASNVFHRCRVARVAADPPRIDGADSPAGWNGIAYFRMHGAPRVYYSDYDEASLGALRERMLAAVSGAAQVWCIFDNTAASHALGNATTLATLIGAPSAADF